MRLTWKTRSAIRVFRSRPTRRLSSSSGERSLTIEHARASYVSMPSMRGSASRRLYGWFSRGDAGAAFHRLAFWRSAAKHESRRATSPPVMVCRDIFSLQGNRAVTSQVDLLNSNLTKIAPRSMRVAGLRLRLICCHWHVWPPESFLEQILFNPGHIEVRTIRRQEHEPCSDASDSIAHTRCLVCRQVVHDHDMASTKRRLQHLLDIGQKDIAVHRTIVNKRRGHSGEA